MMATDTIAALSAAIDAGDDSVLPILADALEETGSVRAEGLRRIPEGCWPREFGGPYRPVWLHVWARCDEVDPLCWGYGFVPHGVYERLQGGRAIDHQAYDDERGYHTRSAAYLALAAALVED